MEYNSVGFSVLVFLVWAISYYLCSESETLINNFHFLLTYLLYVSRVTKQMPLY
jgi:hypothetical protein